MQPCVQLYPGHRVCSKENLVGGDGLVFVNCTSRCDAYGYCVVCCQVRSCKTLYCSKYNGRRHKSTDIRALSYRHTLISCMYTSHNSAACTINCTCCIEPTSHACNSSCLSVRA